MVLQSIYVVYQLLQCEATRMDLVKETRMVTYLIDLLYDRNVEIRRTCDACLDIISVFHFFFSLGYLNFEGTRPEIRIQDPIAKVYVA
jgi:hypothetical protein